MVVGIVDYNAGNLQSVRNAMSRIGCESVMVEAPEDFEGIDLVLLPGQGAFGASVASLQERGLFGPLTEWLSAEKPYLGICVGLQLLLEESEESPGSRGLARFPGVVKKFVEPELKIPHMGWNSFEPMTQDDVIWKGLPGNPHAYFVHSYYCAPRTDEALACLTEYGSTKFVSGMRARRLLAVQFHPEKSQDIGLTLIGNFIDAMESGED